MPSAFFSTFSSPSASDRPSEPDSKFDRAPQGWRSHMASAFLSMLGEGGESVIACEPVEEAEPSISARGSKGKAKTSKADKSGPGQTPRSKKGQAAMLSTSYTCWRKVPAFRQQVN